MKITYRVDYFLKAILDLVTHDGKLVNIHDLAKRAQIPIKFLEQVLLELKRGGFVESRRGKIGGYQLAKNPSEIKVGDVVRFIDGSIEPIDCLGNNYLGCTDIYKCVFRGIWKDVAKATADIVDNISFEDLVNQLNVSQEALVYSI